MPVLLGLIGLLVTVLQVSRLDFLINAAANAGIATLVATGSVARSAIVIDRALRQEGLNPARASVTCQLSGATALVRIQTPYSAWWSQQTFSVATQRLATRVLP